MKSQLSRALVPLIAAVSLMCVSCSLFNSTRSENPERGQVARLEIDIVRRWAHWEADFAKPLAERIRVPTSQELDYLYKDNLDLGFTERPELPKEMSDEVRDLQIAIAGFPVPLKRALERKLGSLLVVRNLGGSAAAYAVYSDPHGKSPVAGFIAIDVAVLNRRANEWATWRESSPFSGSPRYKLRAKIAAAADDTRLRAYQYILLHEAAHVLSIGANVHPNWDESEPAPISNYTFGSLSWKTEKDSIVRATEFAGKELPKTKYYAKTGETMPAERMRSLYEALENSDFVTLYAATSVYEDFAETFAAYVHNRILKRPFSIELLEDGRVAKMFELCFGQARCAKKEGAIRGFYESL